MLVVAAAQPWAPAPAIVSLAPAPDCTVGSDGQAVGASYRHGDDAPTRKGLNLLRQQLVLLVAVAQPATPSNAPAPDGTTGGGGEAVPESSRHSDDALASNGLDLLGQQLALLVAVAQLAETSTASATESAVGGEGEAVFASRRHSDETLASESLDLLRLPLGLLVAVA